MITFVIPVYNRLRNLSLVLEALRLQSDGDFEVVISDDGSDDGLGAFVRDIQDNGPLSIKYYRHEHNGYRVSLTRNQGARLRARDCTHLWFVDSDVLLPRGAVEHVREIITEHPGVVICGRYDWLPPMEVTAQDVSDRWDYIVAQRLPPQDVPRRERDGRPDHRTGDPNLFWDHKIYTPIGPGTLSGNLIIPVKWWILTGGFDENIESQGQDGEFGYNLQSKGAPGMYCGHICGQHLSHAYDEQWMKASVQWTIEYIRKKWKI